jgi:hypothetical protein
MDARDENIIEVEVKPSTKVHTKVKPSIKLQVMAKAQRRVMEIERRES